MAQPSCITCDRHGHVVVAKKRPAAKIKSIRASSDVKLARSNRTARATARKGLLGSDTTTDSPVKQILIPIDAIHANLPDLRPVLQLARRFNAAVMLLHCYSTPRCFSFARGPSAFAEAIRHRNMVRARLFRVYSNVKKSFPNCKCRFASGSLPEEILRASENIDADLIAIPLSLDLVSDGWTTKTLIDELVRRADCPVLGVPNPKEKKGTSRVRVLEKNGGEAFSARAQKLGRSGQRTARGPDDSRAKFDTEDQEYFQ
jgi:hypothetical protein